MSSCDHMLLGRGVVILWDWLIARGVGRGVLLHATGGRVDSRSRRIASGVGASCGNNSCSWSRSGCNDMSGHVLAAVGSVDQAARYYDADDDRDDDEEEETTNGETNGQTNVVNWRERGEREREGERVRERVVGREGEREGGMEGQGERER